MGTDLVTVFEKLKAFEDEAKYWFQCIGLKEVPAEFTETMKAIREEMPKFALHDFKGAGTGRGGEGEPK